MAKTIGHFTSRLDVLVKETKEEKTAERTALETEAQALGVKGNISAMKDETLTKKVNELKK